MDHPHTINNPVAPEANLGQRVVRVARSLAAWRDKDVPVLFIVAFCLLLWGGEYVLRHLWEPDEARFTYISWEMNRSGDWLVPHRDGEFYAHKPVLMFWLIKAGTLLTNGAFNQISGRLPSLLGLVLALWALSRIAARWFDRPAAWRAVFVLSTSALFWQTGGMGQIDMLLLGLEMTALHLLFKTDDAPAVWRSMLAFGFMGLAIMAKGPVGLIIPSGIYICANLAGGCGRKIIRRHWLWGLPLALSLPIAWLLAAKLNGAPDAYFKELLFDQNVGRLAGKFGGHTQPFYYFLKYLPLDFLPWTLFIPMVVVTMWQNPRQRSEFYRLAAWIGFVVCFFSLSGSKRNLYILSAYPAAALLVAAAMPRLADIKQKWQSVSAYLLIGSLGLLGISGIATLWVAALPIPAWPLVMAGILCATGAVLLLGVFRRHQLSARFFSFFIVFLMVMEIIAGTIVLPAFNPIKTPVELARAAPQYIAPNEPLLLFAMTEEILSLYCGRQGLRIDDPDELLRKINGSQGGIVVFSQASWPQMKDRLEGYGEPRPLRVGSQRFIWLAFKTPN